MSNAYIRDELISQGYAIISRKFGIAARIDREDWKERQARHHMPVDADWYRRCVSEDRVTVSAALASLLPNSGTCGYEYRPKKAGETREAANG